MLTNIGTLALALLGAAPTALACLGWTGGLPTPTDTRRISAPIYVRAGEVYDGHWVKYDRNPTTCREDVEGGEFSCTIPAFPPLMDKSSLLLLEANQA